MCRDWDGNGSLCGEGVVMLDHHSMILQLL